ncbi:MAG: hypothetical protein GF308_08715 [Candidatus Heimdallarchaeota archaeon]|nr:hypothetical protein [Candidatus Heimdallarchaeota archaeon]
MKRKAPTLWVGFTLIVLILISSGILGTPWFLLLPTKMESAIPLIEDQELSSNVEEEHLQVAQKILNNVGFFENLGQVSNEDILYYGQFAQGKIGFGTSKIFLWVSGWSSVVTLSFVGAQVVAPIGINPRETRGHFFLGERGTFTNVQQFETICYKGLWSGIDLYYFEAPEGINYRFEIAPQAQPEMINLHVEGQDSFDLTSTTAIFVKDGVPLFDNGFITLQADGQAVNSQLIKKDTNSFGLKISTSNTKQQLNAESSLYSTLVGGSEWDEALAIVLDDDNNAYVTGYTWSTDFPNSTNAYSKTLAGECDCFIFKLSANGSDLLYSTFIGGNSWDEGKDIALDSNDNAIITGYSLSNDFPTSVDAYNKTFEGGGSDIFLSKLSADGSDLLYSTFFGGYGADIAWSIALDNTENIYVTGETDSEDFITTAAAFNRTYSGHIDGFTIKFTADGSELVYSTFIGGNEEDFAKGIALDSDNNAYVTGYTFSSNFPTTGDAYNQTYGGDEECFVFKLSANGSNLLYSTFVGADNMDIARSIAVDSNNNAYVTGFSRSSGFPTTPGAYSEDTGENYGNQEPFVFKLSSDGSDLLYSTFIGGHSSDEANSITLDGSNNAYVTGFTDSDDFPTTANAFSEEYNGYSDCFVFKLSADGSDLLYSTYLGGGITRDEGRGIAVNGDGDAFITGRTESSDFPTTAGAYDETYNDDSRADCFVFRFPHDYQPPTTTSPPTTTTPPETTTPPTTTTTSETETTSTSGFIPGFTLIVSGITIISLVIIIQFIRKKKRSQ